MRRIALISDIHADLAALDLVLAAIKREDEPADEIWCLGDVIGRGLEPIECLERVFSVCSLVLIGNHDAYQIDPDSHDPTLTDYGREQFLPTRALLDAEPRWPEWRERLREQKAGLWMGEKLLAIHASPAEPLWHHLNSVGDVGLLGQALPLGTVVVHGHTHVAACGLYDGKQVKLALGADELNLLEPAAYGSGLELDADTTYFLNPGSTSLPRSGRGRYEWGLLEVDEDAGAEGFAARRFAWRQA